MCDCLPYRSWLFPPELEEILSVLVAALAAICRQISSLLLDQHLRTVVPESMVPPSSHVHVSGCTSMDPATMHSNRDLWKLLKHTRRISHIEFHSASLHDTSQPQSRQVVSAITVRQIQNRISLKRNRLGHGYDAVILCHDSDCTQYAQRGRHASH